MDDKGFQYASKIVPLSGWVGSFVVFSPILSDKYGQSGVECRSLLCRWIMIDGDNKPTNYDPEGPGLVLVLIFGLFMIVLNIATYIQVSVFFKPTHYMAAIKRHYNIMSKKYFKLISLLLL